MKNEAIQHINSVIEKIDIDEELVVDKAYVYVIEVKETDKFYIGVAKNAISRKSHHLHNLRKGTHHNQNLQKEFNNGKELNWNIYQIPSYEEAKELEKETILNSKTNPNCLNSSLVWSNGYLNRKHSEETKQLMSEKAKEAWTDERKQKLSEVMKEQWKNYNEKTLKKMSENGIRLNEIIANDPVKREAKIAKVKEYWKLDGSREKQSQRRKEFFANGGEHYQRGKPIDPEKLVKMANGRDAFYASLSETEKAEHNRRKTEHKKIPVLVGDKEYSTIKEAAEENGISPPSARKRLKSKNFPDWKIK